MTMLQSLDMFVAYQANTINFLSRSPFFGFFFYLGNWHEKWWFCVPFTHFISTLQPHRTTFSLWITKFLHRISFLNEKKLSRLVRQKIIMQNCKRKKNLQSIGIAPECYFIQLLWRCPGENKFITSQGDCHQSDNIVLYCNCMYLY